MANTAQFCDARPQCGGLVPLDQVSFTHAFDGKTVSVLFRGLEVNLSSPEGSHASTQSVAFQLPVELAEDARLIGYIADLRGHVTKTPGARVAVWVDLGGVSSGWEFPYDEAVDGLNFVRTVASAERRGTVEEQPQRPPVPPYAATLVVVVQRRGAEDAAMVSLDSLDVALLD